MEENLIREYGLVLDGEFVPYGIANVTIMDGGIPVYAFNTYADYEAVASQLPNECAFIVLEDETESG